MSLEVTINLLSGEGYHEIVFRRRGNRLPVRIYRRGWVLGADVMRGLLLTLILSMLLGASGVVILFGLCFVMGILGAGMLGFGIFTAPGSALSPFFSFLTSLLPESFVHALVGTSSVGSSLGLLALWSMVSWLVLSWIIAFVVLRWQASRGSLMPSSNRKNTAQFEPHD